MSPQAPMLVEEQAAHRRLMRFGKHPSQVAPVWEARDTNVRAVVAHLAALWANPLSSDNDATTIGERGMAHARASVLNLIVLVVDDDAADQVVETLHSLGARHPSRAIVLVPDPRSTVRAIDARISAHCTETNGGTERVCCEEVILLVQGERAGHLAGIVSPLLIHDLPTHVWWPGDPPFRDPVFDQVVDLGDRVLFDSSALRDLAAGLRRMASLRRRSGIGDLSWERLSSWQELTAQFFDAPRFRRYLPNLSRLQIRYALPRPRADSPDVASPMAQPLLYAGWMATRLGWRRHTTVETLSDGAFRLVLEGRREMVELDIRPQLTDDLRPGELISVRLRSRGETGAGEFIIERDTDDAVVASNADGMTALIRRMPMRSRTDGELLSAQLAMDAVDPVYEDAMRAAVILLASAGEPVA